MPEQDLPPTDQPPVTTPPTPNLEDEREPVSYVPASQRYVGPPSGYGKVVNQQPQIIGFTIIGIIILLTVIAGLWWYFRPEFSLPTPEPTPTPTVNLPQISSGLPIRTATPLVEKTLQDYFDQPAYSITYNVVYNPGGIELLQLVSNYTINRQGELILIEAPLQNSAIHINRTTGEVYTIENTTQEITGDHGALTTVLDMYLMIDETITSQLLSRSEESYRGTVYLTQTYPGLTAFYLNNELVYLRNDNTGTIIQVVKYATEVDESVFTLPSYQVSEHTNTPAGENPTSVSNEPI